jgi:mannose-6-phosphate isomerase
MLDAKQAYPLRFAPIYKAKLWGGRNFERLFGRDLPIGELIGESWELADLPGGASVVRNGPLAGVGLTELTRQGGQALLGLATPMPDGRFPLLIKFLDANDRLSLQVHPDAIAAKAIGGDAARKMECWYMLESREGFIYKGLLPGVTPEAFRRAIEEDAAEKCVRPIDCTAGDFHYLPAGTVHALCAGLVVAEVQTPSDTTYRVTDWGRGREIHVERSMQCIHFEAADEAIPGAAGETLLVTDAFTVAKRSCPAGQSVPTPAGRCAVLMMLAGEGVEIRHAGEVEAAVSAAPGDTLLLPAALKDARVVASSDARWLEVTLPDGA